jgi:hypothetical protein
LLHWRRAGSRPHVQRLFDSRFVPQARRGETDQTDPARPRATRRRSPTATSDSPKRLASCHDAHRTAFAEVSGVDGRFLTLVECQLAPSAPQITRWPDSRRSYKAGVGGSSPSAPTRSEAVFGGPAASLPTGMGSLPHRPPLPSQLPPVAPSHRLTVDHIAVRARPGDSGVDVVIRPLLAAARQNAAMRGGVAMSVAGEGEVCRMP